MSLIRAVVQRVHQAICKIDDQRVGAIDRGLLVFLGIATGDTKQQRKYMIEKILKLRIFENEQDEMDFDVAEVCGGVLLIPQFTLYGDVTRGRRPSFHRAEAPGPAREQYQCFVEEMRQFHQPVETGEFARMMDIQADNDGPVTILIDSEKAF